MNRTTFAAPNAGLADRQQNPKSLSLLRYAVVISLFLACYAVIAGRMVQLHTLREPVAENSIASEQPLPRGGLQKVRADIVDRNGVLLATSLPRPSLCANGNVIKNPEGAAIQLISVLPDLDLEATAERMARPRSCSFIKRGLTRDEQYAVNALGIVGLDFRDEYWRSYPHAEQTAHLVGFANIDNRGLAGVEHSLDSYLKRSQEPVALSIDLRVQAIVNEEMSATIDQFDATAGAAVLLDVETGEVIALSSLPSFDPNIASKAADAERFNRATHGVYELGSVMKMVTVAMALDHGIVTLDDGYDASQPLYVDQNFTIRDFFGKNRWLSVAEIITYSSNIGSAKMALEVGPEIQQSFLRELGLMSPASIQVPEVGKPNFPAIWRPVNTMTVSYGHGLSVSPLQMASATTALVNGGMLHSPTLLKRTAQPSESKRVISEETSKIVRSLMRNVVLDGSGRGANSKLYRMGGKTGTAQQRGKDDERIVSFLSAFPIDDPKYVMLVTVEQPKPQAEIGEFATGGVVAAPLTKRIVERIGPLMGLEPTPEANL